MNTQQVKQAYLQLPPLAKLALDRRLEWLQNAHAYQLPPDNGNWSVWWLNAGRGAGKTRCASEWTWWESWVEKCRTLVLAPTANDLRFTCFEGESGLLNVVPHQLILNYNKSTHELELKNGSIIRGISGDSYERLRGPQFHKSWVDELGAFQYADQSWDMMQFGLRLGTHPCTVVTSTPKPIPMLFRLYEQMEKEETEISSGTEGITKTIYITTASTHENLANLAPQFANAILQYEDTDLGRQEIYAELLDPGESSIYKKSQFRLWPADRPFPRFSYVIASFDMATSEKTTADYSAMCVAGLFKPSEDEALSLMIIDVDRWKCDYVDMREHIKDIADTIYGEDDEWGSGKKVDLILIEDASNGTALISELSRMGLPIRGKKPGHLDKVQRAHLASPLLAKRRVWIPESTEYAGKPKTWLNEFMREITTFPNTPIEAGSGRDEPYDDWVDAFTMCLNFIKNETGYIKLDTIPVRQRYADDGLYKKKKVNPYAV